MKERTFQSIFLVIKCFEQIYSKSFESITIYVLTVVRIQLKTLRYKYKKIADETHEREFEGVSRMNPILFDEQKFALTSTKNLLHDIENAINPFIFYSILGNIMAITNATIILTNSLLRRNLTGLEYYEIYNAIIALISLITLCSVCDLILIEFKKITNIVTDINFGSIDSEHFKKVKLN